MTVEDGVAVVSKVEARRVTKARPVPMSTVELQKRSVPSPRMAASDVNKHERCHRDITGFIRLGEVRRGLSLLWKERTAFLPPCLDPPLVSRATRVMSL